MLISLFKVLIVRIRDQLILFSLFILANYVVLFSLGTRYLDSCRQHEVLPNSAVLSWFSKVSLLRFTWFRRLRFFYYYYFFFILGLLLVLTMFHTTHTVGGGKMFSTF